MKKILFALATVICSLVACDPVSEDFSMGDHITADELKSMSTVTVEKDANGNNGNVISCSTSAPVNAKWTITDNSKPDAGGKELFGNYAWKKLKTGSYTVTLTGLCADGTVVTSDFPVSCDVITQELERYYIYGKPDKNNPNHHLIGFEGEPFSPAAWDAAEMRFSDNEGKHFPYIKDDVYKGKKTLIFDITDATDDCAGRIMNGWWSARYDNDKDVKFTNGQWELQLTDAIYNDCAQGAGGKDLDLMITSGSCTIHNVYYEE